MNSRRRLSLVLQDTSRLTKIRPMKPYLQTLVALVPAGMLWVVSNEVHAL
jgi:hypothetical protein